MSSEITHQFRFEFGVTPEQACFMCHLSSECAGCCRKCHKCTGQACSQENLETQQSRWDTWMYLVANTPALAHLKKFIPKKYHYFLKHYKKKKIRGWGDARIT